MNINLLISNNTRHRKNIIRVKCLINLSFLFGKSYFRTETVCKRSPYKVYTSPSTHFVFDENAFVSTNFIENDFQFSTFLNDLGLGHSISTSFRIIGTLETGESKVINSTNELKQAIDNCIEDEILLEFNSLIQNCAWKIGYSYNFENPYLGGRFYESNGFTTLSAEEHLVFGSWSPLIIGNDLHININLLEETEIGEFFNFDWKVTYIDENSLLLKNEDRELVLNQRCDTDITNCGNFNFEACELEESEGVSEFILDDYTDCIFDTLELDQGFPIQFYETEEDAQFETNPILSNEIYNNTESTKSLYIGINETPEVDDAGELTDDELESFFIRITLSSISCE